MPSARFWRLSQIEPDAKLTLELGGLEVWDANSRIDLSATSTCTAIPSGGSLASLQDGDPATLCAFSESDSNAPRFLFQWDFGVGVTVAVRKFKLWSSTSVTTSPRSLCVEWSSDGEDWLTHATMTSMTALAAGALVEIGIPELGGNVLISTTASSYSAVGAWQQAWDVSATTRVSWPLDFGDTSSLGVFSFANTTTAVAATAPTASGVIPRFNVDDIWDVRAYCGYTANDYCYLDIEFLTADDVIKAAISIGKTAAQTTRYKVGSSLATVAVATNSTAATTSGEITFTTGSIIYTTTAASTSFACDMSQVTKVRVSNARAYSSYTAAPGYAQVYVRIRATTLTGNNTASNAVRGVLLSPLHISFDIYGSTGRITGTVKEKSLPANIPLRRRVRLFSDLSALLVREVWSDPLTGGYSFENISIDDTYTVISTDHTGLYRAVIADKLTPTTMP